MTNAMDEPQNDSVRVGFRDIYRAVGESEARIKEHITLVLLPISQTLNDHETRIRAIEVAGSPEARAAVAAISTLETRMDGVERNIGDMTERRAGSINVLSAQRSLLILVCALVGMVIGIIDFVTMLTGRA